MSADEIIDELVHSLTTLQFNNNKKYFHRSGYIILPGGLRLPRITKLSPKGLNVSSCGIRFKYHT